MSTVSSPAALIRRTQGLADVVVGHVGGHIAGESLRIEGKLPAEPVLMKALGMSHTVACEVTSRLQAKGLIRTCHGVGSFVLPPRIDNNTLLDDTSTIHGILSMLKLRVITKTECTGLAVQRIPATETEALRLAPEAIERDQAEGNNSVTSGPQFHLSIVHAAGNEHFVGALVQLDKTLIPRTWMGLAQVGYLNVPGLRATASREHHSVFEVVVRKDPEVVRAAMRMHLSNSRERLRRAHGAAGTQTTAMGS